MPLWQPDVRSIFPGEYRGQGISMQQWCPLSVCSELKCELPTTVILNRISVSVVAHSLNGGVVRCG